MLLPKWRLLGKNLGWTIDHPPVPWSRKVKTKWCSSSDANQLTLSGCDGVLELTLTKRSQVEMVRMVKVVKIRFPIAFRYSWCLNRSHRCCRPCSRREVKNEGRASSHSPDICAENKTCPNGLKEDARLHWDVSSLYFVMCFFVSFCFPHILTHPENPDYLGAFPCEFHPCPLLYRTVSFHLCGTIRVRQWTPSIANRKFSSHRVGSFEKKLRDGWSHHYDMGDIWGKEPTKDVDSEARRMTSTWALSWKWKPQDDDACSYISEGEPCEWHGLVLVDFELLAMPSFKSLERNCIVIGLYIINY